MKKGIMSGAALLMLLVGFACSHQNTESLSLKQPSKVAPKITVTEKRVSDNADDAESDLENTELKMRSGSCATDEDCAAIPAPPEACIPCGSKAKATTREMARSIMASAKDKCIEKFKNKQVPECKELKASACQEGTCVLVDITLEELQERAKKYAPKDAQGQEGQEEQGGRPQMPNAQPGRGQGFGTGSGARSPFGNSDASWGNQGGFHGSNPGSDQGFSRGGFGDSSRFNFGGQQGRGGFQSGQPWGNQGFSGQPGFDGGRGSRWQ